METQKEKQAILVASFGTSHHDTCERNIGAIERDIAEAFPDWTVRRAFTSGMIVNKLRERDGVSVDTVERALERLAREGYETVRCQPTHVINGEEFDDIAGAAGRLRGRFRSLRVGAPLLTGTEDYRQLAAVIGRTYSPREGTALCLMGHGSGRFADAAYAALEYHFNDQGYGNIHVGTVEGFPDLPALLRRVRAGGADTVLLAPLMVVAGDHAVNDMAGDGEESWKTAFLSAGYRVECVLKGLGEYPEVRGMYVAHLRAVMGEG